MGFNGLYDTLQAFVNDNPRHSQIEADIAFCIIDKECISSFQENWC